MTLKAKALDFLIILGLLSLLAPLRFINLGYSEFQDDEKKAFFRLAEPPSAKAYINFALNQKKGPGQFIVTNLTTSLGVASRDEFKIRFPFAVANLGSCIFLYLVCLNLFKNRGLAVFATLLYGFNGFIVGFGRIAQYQSLNLVFSLASAYFLTFILVSTSPFATRIKFAGVSAILLGLSLLSHWDVIYFLGLLGIIFYKYLTTTPDPTRQRIQILFFFGGVFMLVVLPFLLPYSITQTSTQQNYAYFEKRFGFNTYGWENHLFVLKLYQPFYVVPLLITLAVIGSLYFRISGLYALWFLLNFCFIYFLMQKPGTHVYNYLVPLFVLAAVPIGEIFSSKSVWVKLVGCGIGLFVVGITAYQSYMLFVDHTPEYPWSEKKVFSKLTQPYVRAEVLTFGFPHYRGWKTINSFVTAQDPGKACTYISNEGKEIAQIYMGHDWGNPDKYRCYYLVVITRPFISTRGAIVFPQIVNKKPVFSVLLGTELVAKVYELKKTPTQPRPAPSTGL